MSLSRTSLAPILAAAGCLLLFACKPAAESTSTTTATTESTAATESTATSTSATTAETTTTSGSTSTSTKGAPKYGPGNPPPGQSKDWGKNDTVRVDVTFDKTGNATSNPDTIEVNANQATGKPGTITWVSDRNMKIAVTKATGGPECIQGPKPDCTTTPKTCTATVNPAIYKSQQAPWSAHCTVQIWEAQSKTSSDPDIVIDNCCP